VVDFLQDLVERCVAIFEAVDVGIVLADEHGELVVMASASERIRLVEALQIAADDGPCIDSFTSGTVVSAGSLKEIVRRWPDFATGIHDVGYQSVHAVPLRLRKSTIGSLNFFRDKPGHLEPEDVRAAQTIADVATIGLVQERTVREASAARDQLQHALTARILIEQAKGVISHSRGVDMEQAWTILRHRARSHQARITDIAQGVVDGIIVL
jgi:GAF domain-containing protein